MDYCKTCGVREDQDCKHFDECDYQGISSEVLAKELTDKLLPCPLCGGKPGEDVFFCGVIRPSQYQIKCVPCALTIVHDRQDKVIGYWNARAKVGVETKE